MPYHPTPTLQAYWDAFPFVIHLSKVRCPVHRNTWLFMDEITETAHCFACEHDWTTAEIVAARRASPHRLTLPDEMRRYYPGGVVCPECRMRLALQIADETGACPRCEQLWTFPQLIDAAARRLMEEEPNGATVYRKPRRR